MKSLALEDENLLKFLKGNPQLRERIEALQTIAVDTDDQIQMVGEAEELIFEQLHRLG